MDLNLSMKGEVKLAMFNYLKEILKNFPKEITGRVASLAAEHLFDVQPDNTRVILDEMKSIIFHHAVAKTVSISARARKDFHNVTASLFM